ncbi:23S rRNA m(5)U-1939 methyltransferase [Poseidonocella pacifica]|uniref:23S rRNA m(5)U-1939 methyltransferase n=1 Tax=Poseidonocella pacifica TaxID=871651 RepID=A0A1I0YFD2_9RHOB|nr:class I SAM-dependent RNA methyltransferase [Poseidonocella pacifica]SFB11517.1 23S rRNA m(5)U-1939 methyltransferase [Poseidonocella pacifica]
MSIYEIERLGHQGDGIAAGPVFAPRTLPGEHVTGQLAGDRLSDIRIVEPSAERVAAPCRHYKSCGGCHLQHASDGFVETWKADVVRHALKAQGLEAPIRGVHTSPPQSRRRATFSARRTKKAALSGFHARASDVVIEVPGCLLVQPDVLRGREIAEELVQVGGSRKGELRVTVTSSEIGLDLAVEGGKPLDAALRMDLGQITQRVGIARLTWDDETVAMQSPPTQPMGRAHVAPPPGAFLQATPQGEAALLAAVREAVGPAGRIVDLFAGCGTFSLPLAERAEVHAVETAAPMLEALNGGWRYAHGLRKVTTEVRDLFRDPLVASELAAFGAAVIDPPRAGAESQTRELAQAGVPRVAAVSCNPGTFARDARILTEAGYSLDWIVVVDQFRWSPHVELAAAFSRPV